MVRVGKWANLCVCFLVIWIGIGRAAGAEFLVTGKGEYRFVSYNLRNYQTGKTAGEKEGKPKPRKEIEAVVGILKALQPDGLGVLEVGGQDGVEDLWKRLSAAGLDLPYCTWVPGPDLNRALAFFSRYPIVQEHSRKEVAFELDGERHLMQRGIADVEVEVPGSGVLRFVGVHLKSQIAVRPFDQEAYRYREARELRNHIAEILRKEGDAKVVVWGDFNMAKNAPGFRDIVTHPGEVAGVNPVNLADENGEVWTHYWAEADEYTRIDYILVAPSLAKHLVAKKSGIARFPQWFLASDHRPLYLTLRWQPLKK